MHTHNTELLEHLWTGLSPTDGPDFVMAVTAVIEDWLERCSVAGRQLPAPDGRALGVTFRARTSRDRVLDVVMPSFAALQAYLGGDGGDASAYADRAAAGDVRGALRAAGLSEDALHDVLGVSASTELRAHASASERPILLPSLVGVIPPSALEATELEWRPEVGDDEAMYASSCLLSIVGPQDDSEDPPEENPPDESPPGDPSPEPEPKPAPEPAPPSTVSLYCPSPPPPCGPLSGCGNTKVLPPECRLTCGYFKTADGCQDRTTVPKCGDCFFQTRTGGKLADVADGTLRPSRDWFATERP